MDQAIKEIIARIDGAQAQTLTYDHPYMGKGSVVIAPAGWHVVEKVAPSDPQWTPVLVYDVESFIAYASQHGADKDSAILAGSEKVVGIMDFCSNRKPDRAKNRVVMHCAYSPDTAKQVAVIIGSLGKWINLDGFEEMVQRSGLILANSTRLLESISDLEGAETVKVQRTRTGSAVSVAGAVKSTVELPNEIGFRAVYMGQAIAVQFPFRVTVEAGKIKFQIIDNGALDFATAGARLEVVRQIRLALPEIPVYNGTRGE